MEIPEIKTPQEIHTLELLNKVNKSLETLGVSGRYKRIPESIEGCEILKDKKIVMVDDLANLIKSFIADLTVVTDGKAEYVLHTKQSAEELAREILEKNPDIVLMDKNLADDLNGTLIVKNIVQQNPEIICIGFSSESHSGKEFLSAGARGFIDKDTINTAITMQNIARIVLNK